MKLDTQMHQQRPAHLQVPIGKVSWLKDVMLIIERRMHFAFFARYLTLVFICLSIFYILYIYILYNIFHDQAQIEVTLGRRYYGKSKVVSELYAWR